MIDHVRSVIDDPRVEVSVDGFSSEPSPISSHTGPAWDLLSGTIRSQFPEAAIAPGLVVATTDSRHFRDVARDVYRFLPVRLVAEDLPRIHGRDERVPIEQLPTVVSFYREFLARVGAWSGEDLLTDTKNQP